MQRFFNSFLHICRFICRLELAHRSANHRRCPRSQGQNLPAILNLLQWHHLHSSCPRLSRLLLRPQIKHVLVPKRGRQLLGTESLQQKDPLLRFWKFCFSWILCTTPSLAHSVSCPVHSPFPHFFFTLHYTPPIPHHLILYTVVHILYSTLLILCTALHSPHSAWLKLAIIVFFFFLVNQRVEWKKKFYRFNLSV